MKRTKCLYIFKNLCVNEISYHKPVFLLRLIYTESQKTSAVIFLGYQESNFIKLFVNLISSWLYLYTKHDLSNAADYRAQYFCSYEIKFLVYVYVYDFESNVNT